MFHKFPYVPKKTLRSAEEPLYVFGCGCWARVGDFPSQGRMSLLAAQTYPPPVFAVKGWCYKLAFGGAPDNVERKF